STDNELKVLGIGIEYNGHHTQQQMIK
ncbi:unnamed protein product, partial [Allacma fusca]